MYKKVSIVLFLVVMGMIFINNTYAEDDIQGTYLTSCDQSDDLSKTIRVEAGKESDICLQFSTVSEEPLAIKYSFINKDLDADGDPVCAVNRNEKDIFNNIFPDKTEREIIVNKDAPSIIKEKVRIPLGASGSIVGCIAYTTQKLTSTGIAGMMSLVVRKVFPLSFFVGGSESIKNSIKVIKNSGGVYSTNTQVKATVNGDNGLDVNFRIKNDGNITQNIVVTGKVYNFFGFEKEFSITQEIAPGITGDLLSNVGLLPGYKGFFTIKYTIENNPKFDFDTSSIDEKYTKGGNMSGEAQIYIFSWSTLIAIIVLLLLIIKFFWPRKKIILQQPIQTVQQPIQS